MVDAVAPSSVSRRRFLDWLIGTSAGGLLLAVLYPVSRYFIPPPTGESATTSVTLPLKPEDVAPNTGRIFKFGSRPGILVRTPSGELRAFTATCTHLGCIVQHRPDLGRIWCACHNGHFDLNGMNVSGPPPRPLEPYDVHVRGNQIVVSKGA
jgi:Rieske Fe-S protein